MKKLFLLLSNLLLISYANYGQTIINVSTTESRCYDNGTAQVNATGSGLTYTLTSGPAGITLPPSNSTGFFSGLVSGTFTVSVTNGIATDEASFNVPGNYIYNNPTATFRSPTCAGGTNGMIRVTNSAGVRNPVQYRLVSPSVTDWQSTDSFVNLSSGTYQFQTMDSCNNLQTRTITIPNPQSDFTITNYGYDRYKCDSALSAFRIQPLSGHTIKYPLTLSYVLPDGSNTSHVISGPTGGTEVIDSVRYFFTRLASQDSVYLTVTDLCGYSKSLLVTPYYYSPNLQSFVSGCGQLGYNFNYILNLASPWANNYAFYYPDTVRFVLRDNVTGIMDTQTVVRPAAADGVYTNGIVGRSYTIFRIDNCGITDSINFIWGTPTPVNAVVNTKRVTSCIENTTGVWVDLNYGFGYQTVIMKSGPASVTLYDGTVVNYSYPDTLYYQVTNGNKMISGLGIGTYLFEIIDSCGQSDTVSVTINDNDVLKTIRNYSFYKTCDGYNLIRDVYSIFPAPPYGWVHYITVNSSPTLTGFNKVLSGNTDTVHLKDTIVNVTTLTSLDSLVLTFAPTGVVTPNFNSVLPTGYGTDVCTIYRDTIDIPTYTPLQLSSPSYYICPATNTLEVNIDTASGKGPFVYRINSGPGITSPTAWQSSNSFVLSAYGTYQVSVRDSCLNSIEHSVIYENFDLITPEVSPNPCLGENVIITLPTKEYTTYYWTLPDGSSFTGNQLNIASTVSSSYGTYEIMKVYDRGTCLDTVTVEFELNACYSLTGNVYNDLNGITDSFISGTPISAPSGQQLYAYLVDGGGNTIISSMPVNPDGTFSFIGLQPGLNYGVIVAKAYSGGTISELIDGWKFTGGDSTQNSIFNNPNGIYGFDQGTTNLNLHFGLNKGPDADSILQILPTPPSGNQIPAGTVTELVSGSDFEQGSLQSDNPFVVGALPTNATMYYNGVLVNAGDTISNFNPALLSFTGITIGSTSVQFIYSFIDSAGTIGSNAPYKIEWTTPLSLTLVDYNSSADGCTIHFLWTTAQEKGDNTFSVQISQDGTQFVTVAELQSIYPNAGGTYNYFATDLKDGTYYTRLMVTDEMGDKSYSNVVKVQIVCTHNNRVAVYPNPAKDKLSIDLGNLRETVIKIFSIDGRLLNEINTLDRSKVEISTEALSDGIYFIHISKDGKDLFTEKLIITK